MPVELNSTGFFMNKSTFNPAQQENDISSKIVAAMERVSEVFKILLWEQSKLVGLSPLQIQILIFIAFHKQNLCNVSHLAKEFNVTKPTVSDAIKVLDKKGLIIKDYTLPDSRSYSILISHKGKDIIAQIENFSTPLKNEIDAFSQDELESLFDTLSVLIYKLNRKGILSVQRTCYGCNFYKKRNDTDYCNLLQKELAPKDIRIDCSEYEGKTAS